MKYLKVVKNRHRFTVLEYLDAYCKHLDRLVTIEAVALSKDLKKLEKKES